MLALSLKTSAMSRLIAASTAFWHSSALCLGWKNACNTSELCVVMFKHVSMCIQVALLLWACALWKCVDVTWNISWNARWMNVWYQEVCGRSGWTAWLLSCKHWSLPTWNSTWCKGCVNIMNVSFLNISHYLSIFLYLDLSLSLFLSPSLSLSLSFLLSFLIEMMNLF